MIHVINTSGGVCGVVRLNPNLQSETICFLHKETPQKPTEFFFLYICEIFSNIYHFNFREFLSFFLEIYDFIISESYQVFLS